MDQKIINEVSDCRICQEHLPLGPKPIFQIHPEARMVIIGQAPGRLAHLSGIPWDDPSGNRLRDWLEIDKATFYDASRIAILPMGFCYPGKGKSGDLPPRKECAPQWHDVLMNMMPNLKMKLLIGQYAQKAYLKERFQKNLTETVRNNSSLWPEYFALPHPSPLNGRWLKRNDWFRELTIPELRKQTQQLLS